MARPTAYYTAECTWTKEVGKQLTPAAFKLYFMMLAHADSQDNTCWPKQSTLAELVGCGRRHVCDLLEELKFLGLVKVKECRKAQGKSNIYEVMRPQMRVRRLNPTGMQ